VRRSGGRSGRAYARVGSFSSVRSSDGDDDLPSGVAGPDVAEGVGCFVEGVGAVDDRRDLPGREEVGQGEQVLALPDRQERLQLLTGEPGQHARCDDPTEGPEPAAAASAVGDEGAAWAINLAVAEQIRRRPRRGTPAAPVQVPLP